MRYAQIGSVSSGTMRTDDLLDALSGELDYQMKRQPARHPRKAHRQIIREAGAVLNGNPKFAEYGDDIVQELFDALGEYAAPYCYFGASEGDGSDYGFWLCSDFTERMHDDGVPVVDDFSELPDGYHGEVCQISDHGNASFGFMQRNGKFVEAWSCV
jgi:hypothetical protein